MPRLLLVGFAKTQKCSTFFCFQVLRRARKSLGIRPKMLCPRLTTMGPNGITVRHVLSVTSSSLGNPLARRFRYTIDLDWLEFLCVSALLQIVSAMLLEQLRKKPWSQNQRADRRARVLCGNSDEPVERCSKEHAHQAWQPPKAELVG